MQIFILTPEEPKNATVRGFVDLLNFVILHSWFSIQMSAPVCILLLFYRLLQEKPIYKNILSHKNITLDQSDGQSLNPMKFFFVFFALRRSISLMSVH